MDDRVFVCLGATPDGQRQVWVMTIDKNFEHVTFWEIKKQKGASKAHYVLPQRIKKGQQKYIEAYLSPTISEEEHKKIKKMREDRIAASLGESMVDDYKPKQGDAGDLYIEPKEEDKDEEKEESEPSFFGNEDMQIVRHSELD